jgi:4-amino-4-deoxy-L-arabinose transferase-like glycosyltransferase
MSSTVVQSAVSTRRLIFLSSIVALALVVFVLSDLASLNHNDFMYAVAPAVWAQNGALYTVVPFVQAPLSILLNAALIALTGNVNVFLPARIISIVLVLVAVLLPVLNRARMRDPELWVLYVALALTNFFVASNSREIGNYALSLLCLSAAITVIGAPGFARWRGLAAFICAGLAVSAKLYFALMCPALFIYFLLTDRSARDPVVIAACGLGLILGLAPILYFLVRDPQSFLLWNVQIHQKILPLRVASAADGVRRIANTLTVFVVLLAIPIGFFIVATRHAWRSGGVEWRDTCAKLVLLVTAGLMAISPIFLFEQYFGPLAFLLLLFSAPWKSPGNSTGERTRSMYLIFGGAMFCMQCFIAAQLFAPDTIRDGDLVVSQVLKAQSNARQIVVNGYNCERKLYTAAPLFLLENEVKYPPEFAAGPFLLFLRGEPLARKGEEFDIDAHIKKWNPDIVMWGYHLGSREAAEDAVDRFMRDYAIGHHFVVQSIGQVDGHTIELGYRPGCKG